MIDCVEYFWLIMAEAKTWKNMGKLSGKPGKPGILTKIKSGHPVEDP